jgi:hypothetical protein
VVADGHGRRERDILPGRSGAIAHDAVARMYQADGLAWLERQADLAEAIVATRRAAQPLG